MISRINFLKFILVLFFVFISGIIFCLSNHFVEPTVSDFFVKTITNRKDHGSKDIVLVVIDDASLEKIRWPWRRDLYAEIFDFLENEAKAKIIFFDAVLSSPDPYSKEADDIFFNYLKKSKKLILGFNMCHNDNKCVILPDKYIDEFKKKTHVRIINNKKTPQVNFYSGIMDMPMGFFKSAKNLGSVIVMQNIPNQFSSDKTIRTYSNLTYLNGNYYPSIALLGYSILTNDNDFILTDKELYSKNTALKIKFPADANSPNEYFYLKWYKPYPNSVYYTHKDYSAIDVLTLSRLPEGSVLKISDGEDISVDTFKNKIVFVGGNASAQSLDDKLGSPVSIKHAGVDIQATALNNYLDNTFTFKAGNVINIFICAVILLISFFIICKSLPVVAVFLNFVLFFFYFLIYLICLNNNIIINFITVLLLQILLFAFAYIYQFMVVGDKKAKIQTIMGKYLSTDVMQKVVDDLDNFSLGGKKVKATIMFIDIRKFTTISEILGADEVTKLLNEYYTTVYPIITKYNGILNKFIGDAVLVIFENPESHAKDAVYCASEILNQVKLLQQKWINEGKPKINVGVGINSGEVFIGNIGTQERMEYTVIGDTVNTANRIEGYNKIYKTKFLIGESTYNFVKNIVDVIKINQVPIRGKVQKANIYEVLRIIE